MKVISTPEPVLVRMHAVNIFSDMLDWKPYERDGAEQIHAHHREEGRACVVLLRIRSRPSYRMASSRGGNRKVSIVVR